MKHWIKVYRWTMYTENGTTVKYGTGQDHNGSEITVYIYRYVSPTMVERVYECNINTLRSGLRRGTYVIR